MLSAIAVGELGLAQSRRLGMALQQKIQSYMFIISYIYVKCTEVLHLQRQG